MAPAGWVMAAVFIGGTWRHSAPRAAAIGDGWMPQGEAPGEFEEALALLQSELARHGRSADGFLIQRKLPMWEASPEATAHAMEAGSMPAPFFEDDYDAALEYVRENEALGVTHLRLELRASAPDNVEQMEAFAANVLAPLAR